MRQEYPNPTVGLIRIAVVATAYTLLGWLSKQFAYLPDMSSLVWLPAGAALGLTYWWGYRVGLLGAGLGALALVWLHQGMLDLALLTAFPVMAQAGVGVWLLRKLQVNPRMPHWRDSIQFIAVCAVASFISPFLNVLLRVAYDIIPESQWHVSVLHRWMGDFIGHLTVGGVLLVWWNNWRMRKRDYSLLSALTLLAMASVWLGFHLYKIGLVSGPSMVIMLPTIVAATFIYQQRGVSWMCVVIVIMLAEEVARWKLTAPIQFPEFMVGWFFVVISFGVFMTVASALTQQREYARRLKEAYQQTEQAYQQVNAILENAPTLAMQMYDERGRVLFWNRASEKLYGYSAEQAIGKTMDQLILTPEENQEFLKLLQKVAETGEPAPLREWRVQTAHGKERYILSSLFPIHFDHKTRYVCADIDVTEQKALEQRVFRAEKMESIGQLAGGIAHDFNNLLTAILGFAELAQERLPQNHPAQNDLKRIVEASERAANLIRQLLGFARKQLTHPQPTEINRVVREMLPLIERSFSELLRIELRLTNEDTTVYVDPTQLEQVLMNLAVNARDAMLKKGGGVLTIATLRKSFTHELPLTCVVEEPVPSGDYVCLEVRDTGEGIPEHLRVRIFEPFFSTKGVGNTGLGLATVYGIVRQNHGFVLLESEVGVGTTFTVCFPAWTESRAAQVQSVS